MTDALRFRVTLRGVAPPIWRELELLSSGSLWDLHVAIQDAMGWQDCHLHVFRFDRVSGGPIEVGFPDPDVPPCSDRVLPTWEQPLSAFFREVGTKATYEYDLGDGWLHDIDLVGSVSRERGVRYPRCLAGARACPPEDCGGVSGYQHLLEVIVDPQHEEFASMRRWLGGTFDPDAFDAGAIRFDNARRRLKRALSDEP